MKKFLILIFTIIIFTSSILSCHAKLLIETAQISVKNTYTTSVSIVLPALSNYSIPYKIVVTNAYGDDKIATGIGGGTIVDLNDLTPDTSYEANLYVNNTTNVISTCFFKTLKSVSITTISPSSGGIKTEVVIVGENFARISKVLFGKIEADIKSINATNIVVVVPAGLSSDVKVTVMIEKNSTKETFIFGSDLFHYIPASITFSKEEGELTIQSTSDISNSTVLFTGVSDAAIPKTNSKNLITVNIPTNATTGKITVKTANSGDIVSTEDFVVVIGTTPPPEIENTPPVTPPPSTPDSIFDKIKPGNIIPKCNTILNPTNGTFDDPCGFSMAITLINNLINFIILTLATPLFALIIIYVGWLYLSSGGSSENVSKAKTILKNVIIGYVIILAAWLIVHTILSALGFTGNSFLG